jgi:hypothetical protein
VGDHHRTALGRHDAHLDVTKAATQPHQHRVTAVADLADLLLAFEDADARGLRVGHVHELDLRDHQRA